MEMIGLDVTRKIVLNADLLSYIERLDPERGRIHTSNYKVLL